MDQTTAHPATAAAEPTPVLPALYELIAERAAPERRDALTAFAKAYLRRLTDDDLAEYSLDSLYALVASTFAFTDTRGSRPSIVRVFDPTLEDDGYRAPGSVIETNTDDSPFLVDSVQEELVARNLVTRRLMHPVVGTSRDVEGRIERVMSGRDASHRESVMHFEVDRRLSAAEKSNLTERLERILHEVHLVVRDFEPMQERVRHMIDMAARARSGTRRRRWARRSTSSSGCSS